MPSANSSNPQRKTNLLWAAVPCVAAVAGLAFASLDRAEVAQPDDRAFLVALDGESVFDPFELARVEAEASAEVEGGGTLIGTGQAAGIVLTPGSGSISPPTQFRDPRRRRSPFRPTQPGTGPFG